MNNSERLASLYYILYETALHTAENADSQQEKSVILREAAKLLVKSHKHQVGA